MFLVKVMYPASQIVGKPLISVVLSLLSYCLHHQQAILHCCQKGSRLTTGQHNIHEKASFIRRFLIHNDRFNSLL